MLLFNDIEHLYSQANYIGDVADKIMSSDWCRHDKLQLADSELGIYFIYCGNNTRESTVCIEEIEYSYEK